MASVDQAGRLVRRWLEGEQDYQLGKFDGIYGSELRERRRFIFDDEIPAKWASNVYFRSNNAPDQANQQLLKVCAASRAVVLYDGCIQGTSRPLANVATYDMFAEHLGSVSESDLPNQADLVETDFDKIFGNKGAKEVYLRAIDLALVATIETEMQDGFMHLPIPGIPSGPTTQFIA